MPISIRLAKTKKDVYGFMDVQATTWAETYQNPKRGLTKEMILSHFEKRNTEEKILKRFESLKDPTNKHWIAIDNEKVIAWFGCFKDFEKQSGSGAIYVLPEYQGKGIGRKMLKKGFKWLSDMKYIEIGVLEYNEVAIEWYMRLGFEFTGEKEDLAIGDFIGKNWILKMRKELHNEDDAFG